jgi:acyl-CoA thioester hydrolase
VRYVECDLQAVVFNVHYFTYFDVAMTEFHREVIGAYSEMVDGGADMVVAEAHARYLALLDSTRSWTSMWMLGRSEIPP